MKTKLKSVPVFFLILALLYTHTGFAQLPTTNEKTQQEPTTVTIKIIDGFFHRLDSEKKLMYVAIDKHGKILQTVNLGQIESVYLIQGKPEKLKGLLTGGSIGAVVGFSSLFWRNLTGSNKSKTDNQSDNKINITDLAIRIGGGAGVGLIVGYFRGQGEEDIRSFPVYDPKIKQTNPHPSIDFSDMANLAKMLREKESFVHVTLKEGEQK